MSSYPSPFRLPVGLDAVSWHWFFSAISLWEGDGDCTVRRSYGKRTPAPNQWGKKGKKRLKKIENGEGKDYRQRYDPFLDRFPNRFGGLVKLHPIHRGRQPPPLAASAPLMAWPTQRHWFCVSGALSDRLNLSTEHMVKGNKPRCYLKASCNVRVNWNAGKLRGRNSI